MNNNRQTPGSLQEFSLDLTNINHELESHSHLDTLQVLEYSKTTILSPIKHEPEPLFSIKINHNQEQQDKNSCSRMSSAFQDIIAKERNNSILNCLNLVLQKLQTTPKNNQTNTNGSQKRLKIFRNVTNLTKNFKSKSCPKDGRKTERNQSNSSTKSILSFKVKHYLKQNQEHFDMHSSKANQETPKRKIVKLKKQKDSPRKQYSPQQKTKGRLDLISSTFLTKKISLGNNEIQQKKYLQKIIQNRQSLIRESTKSWFLPLI